MDLYAERNGRRIKYGNICTIEFIGNNINNEDAVLVVVSFNNEIYLIGEEGLKLYSYNLKLKPIAQKLTTDNFEVELWQTDNTYSLYLDKYLMVEMLKEEEVDELIYILQEARKLKQ